MSQLFSSVLTGSSPAGATCPATSVVLTIKRLYRLHSK
jgi:hypothetical protein